MQGAIPDSSGEVKVLIGKVIVALASEKMQL